MSRTEFGEPTNPYHYAVHCIGGKWKMTILHEIHTFGRIHFNQTLRVLPVSEKVLSQQLKELVQDGLIQRIVDGDTYPPTIDYVLTRGGSQLMPVLDSLYIWCVRHMHERQIPIDEDAFTVHQDDHYTEALRDVIDKHGGHKLLNRDPSTRDPRKKNMDG